MINHLIMAAYLTLIVLLSLYGIHRYWILYLYFRYYKWARPAAVPPLPDLRELHIVVLPLPGLREHRKGAPLHIPIMAPRAAPPARLATAHRDDDR